MSTGGQAARTRGRVWLIAALVCGSFGIGTSEFVVMGLLPQIAADLLPELYSENVDSAVALVGTVVSFYALGVVAGMILTPLVLRRFTLRTTILTCAAAMFVWTLGTAMAPTLEIAVALRFLSSLTHASYVGLAALLVGRMLGAQYQGRGASLVLGGFAIAALVGVPLGTLVGESGNWRLVLAFCAVLFLVPVIALLMARSLGADRAEQKQGAGAEGGSIAQLVVLIAVGTVIAIGGFMLLTFVSPIVVWLQGGPELGLPVAVFMLMFGVGMNLGNFGGGWLTDISAEFTLLLSGASGVLGAILLSIPMDNGITAAAGMLLVGVSIGAYSPPAQILFVATARRWPKLAASFVSGTTNLGSFVGASIGAVALSSFGARAVVILALVLLILGSLGQLIRMTRPAK